MNDPFLAVGYKKGQMDFAISCAVQELSFSEMQDLRCMIVAAIGTMEDMWRRERDKRNPVQCGSK